MRTFSVQSLGCKVNQYESQAIREALLAAGHREVPPGAGADLCIIDTCTVTAASDEKCRKLIHRAVRKNPNAQVVVTGCYAQRDPEALRTIKGVAAVFPGRQKADLVAFAGGALAPPARKEGIWSLRVSSFSGHSRGFVKVQDGCDAGCSYCVVPLVRGKPESRPLAEVVSETERLVSRGYREIVLTGIRLGRYETPAAGGLPLLLRRILQVEGLGRVRLSSIEPAEVTDALLEVMESEPRICSHLHLPLQSGSDRILGAMKRPYSVGEFLELLDRVRRRLDEPGISTDVMVGFPGERESDFGSTLEACRRARFSRMHIFTFSPRPLTPASCMPGRPTTAEVHSRLERLKQLAAELSSAYARKFIGHEAQVLVESRPDGETGLPVGYSERYIRVLIREAATFAGQLVPVKIESAAGSRCVGVIAERHATGAPRNNACLSQK